MDFTNSTKENYSDLCQAVNFSTLQFLKTYNIFMPQSPAEPYGDANPFLSQLHNNNTRGLVSSAMYSFMKRNRSEKRAIPEEQKDEKYFERRRRNNEAAKKSRDARKMREDQIALRASILEQENALLRAQLLIMKEELEGMKIKLRQAVLGSVY